jgi:hypothetical protein
MEGQVMAEKRGPLVIRELDENDQVLFFDPKAGLARAEWAVQLMEAVRAASAGSVAPEVLVGMDTMTRWLSEWREALATSTVVLDISMMDAVMAACGTDIPSVKGPLH